MDNLTAGNPVAHRVRVYFEGTGVIYEGMPVCYNYDTTTNWFGGSVSNGEVTATGTTVEGSQNEGKYIRVELPGASNLAHFAGVVARGGWCGKTGPKVLDIYVPNGAIVPVRCDIDTTTGVTALYITSGEEELGALAAASRPVAIAMETETALDVTADITLAKLDPNLFPYISMVASTPNLAAGVAYASTTDAPALATGDIMIPIAIDGTTYYLVALQDTGV